MRAVSAMDSVAGDSASGRVVLLRACTGDRRSGGDVQRVALYHRAPGFNTTSLRQSDATYFTYRDQSRVFEDIGLWQVAQVSVARSGSLEPEQALRATDRLLPLFRVRPLLGDLLRKEDDRPGAPNRVLLTYGYWQRAFGGLARHRRSVAGDRGQPLRGRWSTAGVFHWPSPSSRSRWCC